MRLRLERVESGHEKWARELERASPDFGIKSPACLLACWPSNVKPEAWSPSLKLGVAGRTEPRETRLSAGWAGSQLFASLPTPPAQPGSSSFLHPPVSHRIMGLCGWYRWGQAVNAKLILIKRGCKPWYRVDPSRFHKQSQICLEIIVK